MKIITVTIFRSFNFGAVLQAYALHKKLNDLGNECFVLNYRPKDTEESIERVFQKAASFKSFIYNLIPLFKYKESKRKIINSNSFLKKHLKLTEKYETYDELISNAPQADVFICGSDQIWNPLIFDGLNPLYFLDFVDSNKAVKASFAASIGENFIDDKYKAKIKEYLSTFDKISVREEKAKELLEYTENDIEVVSDPVFLLNKKEWLNISKPSPIQGKYVLCYFLYQPKFLNEVLRKLKDETGYQIVTVTLDAYSKIYCDKQIRDAAPDDFLGLVANAELVITSSFHGTALSILLEKQFYSVIMKSRGSRITSILNKLDLSDRELTEQSPALDLKKAINYAVTTKLVENLRSHSIEYLETVLDKSAQRG